MPMVNQNWIRFSDMGVHGSGHRRILGFQAIFGSGTEIGFTAVNTNFKFLMIPEFNDLNDAETELVLKAPILVCILVAGADGHIDRKEIKEAISIAQKQKDSASALSGYFAIMAEDFEDKIKVLIQSYPYESTQRTPLLVEELQGLNKIWKKLNPGFASAYYAVLKKLAGKIATSSGGLWGMKSVTPEEARYAALSMLADPAKI
jgi:hypothetical protein